MDLIKIIFFPFILIGKLLLGILKLVCLIDIFGRH